MHAHSRSAKAGLPRRLCAHLGQSGCASLFAHACVLGQVGQLVCMGVKGQGGKCLREFYRMLEHVHRHLMGHPSGQTM